MDYEKKYNEALERAKKFEEKYGGGYAEYIFPELRESEDERIRKELKEAFEVYDIESKWNGIPIRSIFAWLEKQKEQKPVEYLDKDKVYAIMIKLTILSYSKLIPINSDEFKKLHEITSDVRSLLDYPIKQKPSFSCGHENDAEWIEEEFSKTISLVYKAIRKALASLAVYSEDEVLLDSKEETLCYYSQRCAEKIFKLLRPSKL